MPVEGVNFSEMIYEYLKAKGPEPVATADLMRMFEAEGITANQSSVSATLTGLPGMPSRPGVIKTAKGLYAYRPGEKSLMLPSQHRRGSIGSKIISYFENGGGPIASTREMADALGLSTKQAAQATGYLVTNDPRFTRVQPGLIEFNPMAIANVNGAKVKTRVTGNNQAFAPVVAAIPDLAWRDVGMNVVGRTKDGDLLAIDEKGTAWAVSVAVTAKLV